jgi:hypothetical protein
MRWGIFFDSWLQLAMLAADRLSPEPNFPRPGGQPRPSIVPGETAQRLTADAIAWFAQPRNRIWLDRDACRTDDYAAVDPAADYGGGRSDLGILRMDHAVDPQLGAR